MLFARTRRRFPQPITLTSSVGVASAVVPAVPAPAVPVVPAVPTPAVPEVPAVPVPAVPVPAVPPVLPAVLLVPAVPGLPDGELLPHAPARPVASRTAPIESLP